MRTACLLLFALCASSCQSKPPVETDYFGAQIGIVNHTEKYIYSTSVEGGGGGHSERYSAGVANVCCVRVPKKWYPGMKFLVSWDMPEGSLHIIKEKVVDVEKYDEPGSVYLHFFPNDEIRIVISRYFGESKKHPIAPPPAHLYEQTRKK